MAEHPVFRVVPSPTNDNWKIEREGDETPLLFVDSKEEAVEQAEKMVKEHGGKMVIAKGKAKSPKKRSSKKKAA